MDIAESLKNLELKQLVIELKGQLLDVKEQCLQYREEIDKLAGRSLSQLCFAGPEEELKRTIK
jgi:hypothetical protein